MFLRHMHKLLIMLVILPASLALADSDTLRINIVIHDVVTVEEAFVPQEFALHPPYPNPFNPDVNLVVDIPEQAQTRISIDNMRGQEIAVLENYELSPGRYNYQWLGTGQPSGIYFVRILAGQYEESQKISLLK